MQLPVPSEPLVALGLGLTALVVLGALPALAYWAAREARARDGSPTFTLVYPPGRRERLAAAYVLAVAVLLVTRGPSGGESEATA